MNKTCAILLAEGFEEIEALAPADILRRAGVEVDLVSITGKKTVSGSHGIQVTADLLLGEITNNYDLIILPGGLPGAEHLNASKEVIHLVQKSFQEGKWIAAICAAPMVLGTAGVIKGKRFTCYPGFENKVIGGHHTGARVERDGQFITGKGPGAVFEFSLQLTSLLAGEATAKRLKEGMLIL